jgi:hypothetical protein
MAYDRAFHCGALAVMLIMFVGCAEKTAGPDTYSVTGVVTQAGKPVNGAVVQFSPTSTDLGSAGAQASTAADGKFELFLELEMGQAKKRGLPAGEYRVAITKLEIPDKFTTMMGAPKNLLPTKYGALETTPLTAIVKAEGENHFEFPLE